MCFFYVSAYVCTCDISYTHLFQRVFTVFCNFLCFHDYITGHLDFQPQGGDSYSGYYIGIFMMPWATGLSHNTHSTVPYQHRLTGDYILV